VVTVEFGLPDFCAELEAALERRGLTDVAAQVRSAHITSRCSCGEPDCATFTVQSSRALNVVERNVIGERHGGSHEVEGLDGLVVVDLDNFGRLTQIEVLYRPDVADKLESLHLAGRAG
jgi:hypothetical protein